MKKALKILAFAALASAGLVLLALGGFEVTARLSASWLPDVIDSKRFSNEIWQTTRVYSSDGVLLQEFYRERRTLVALDELPGHLLDAVTSAEDKNFNSHGGVDWLAVARAGALGVMRGRFTQGGSTITQQLARNLYFSRKRNLWRKIKESLMARKMERTLDKAAILSQYLNLIYWGHGRFGIEEAAQFYFGKPASGLTLEESALLAGMISAPELFSPLKSPDKALKRMQFVINQMQDEGKLPAELKELVMPAAVGGREAHPELAPYGVDAALVQLFRQVPRETLETGGYVVTASVDSGLQQRMNEGISRVLPSLELDIQTSMTRPDVLCSCLQEARVSPGCPIWAEVLQAVPDKDAWRVNVLGRVGIITRDSIAGIAGMSPAAARLEPGQFVRVLATAEFSVASPWLTEEFPVIPLVVPQVAAVLLDARTGEIRAVYGGVDHRYHPYNRALSARRQLGSTIKPFIYLAAMETLGWGPDRTVDARRLSLPGPEGRRWKIKDAHRHGDKLSMEEALAWSSNAGAVRTLQAMGLAVFRQRWEAWGFPQVEIADLSVALGSVSMTPLELAECYAMLANARCRPESTMLLQARDPRGEAMLLPPRFCHGTPGRAEAADVVSLLKATTRYGTGKTAALEGLEVAAKTGTTREGRDAWFAGIVGQQVLVVWVGADDQTPIKDNSGPGNAARIWKSVGERVFSREGPAQDTQSR